MFDKKGMLLYLICNFDKKRGDPFWGVVMMRHIVDHFNNMNNPHQRLFHLSWIFQVDGVTRFLNRTKKFRVISRFHVIFIYPPINVIPNL